MLTFAMQLDWLVKLANLPAWKQHAWHRALELDKQDGFEGMSGALTQRMNGLAAGMESDRQILGKPRCRSQRL